MGRKKGISLQSSGREYRGLKGNDWGKKEKRGLRMG